jgi:hypothetical protein
MRAVSHGSYAWACVRKCTVGALSNFLHRRVQRIYQSVTYPLRIGTSTRSHGDFDLRMRLFLPQCRLLLDRIVVACAHNASLGQFTNHRIDGEVANLDCLRRDCRVLRLQVGNSHHEGIEEERTPELEVTALVPCPRIFALDEIVHNVPALNHGHGSSSSNGHQSGENDGDKLHVC